MPDRRLTFMLFEKLIARRNVRLARSKSEGQDYD